MTTTALTSPVTLEEIALTHDEVGGELHLGGGCEVSPEL